MMRISGGQYKNKRIATDVKGLKNRDLRKIEYRPSTDRTRQAVFNILQNSAEIHDNILKNAIVLDLFCGSGSFGVEAFSRGASHVYFIDNAIEQIELARFNVDSIDRILDASFFKSKAPKLPKAERGCNLIFLDPPYCSDLILQTLDGLSNNNWLAEKHVIVIELSAKEELQFSEKFEILDTREYGKTRLIFCKRN